MTLFANACGDAAGPLIDLLFFPFKVAIMAIGGVFQAFLWVGLHAWQLIGLILALHLLTLGVAVLLGRRRPQQVTLYAPPGPSGPIR